MITYCKYVCYGSARIEKQVPVASEQVPVGAEGVPVRPKRVPVRTQQVLIGYELTPRGTLGVKMSPFSLRLANSHNAEIGRFCE
jgi:hypothetical protein